MTGARVTIEDQRTIQLLLACCANRTAGRTGVAAQRAYRAAKRDLWLAVRGTARIEGRPVVGAAWLTYELRLSRVDWDGPIKALQDTVAGLLLDGGDDRAIVQATVTLERPSAGAHARVVCSAWPAPVLGEG